MKFATNYENVGNKGLIATTVVTDDNDKPISSSSVFIPGLFIDEDDKDQNFIDVVQLLDKQSIAAHKKFIEGQK